ncbi:cingulin-like [Amia ocellicauda]|uniref:cingulin-like n=1 Tax=Amia ocellicauda TaxID=2972642 RepID=UPI003464C751
MDILREKMESDKLLSERQLETQIEELRKTLQTALEENKGPLPNSFQTKEMKAVLSDHLKCEKNSGRDDDETKVFLKKLKTSLSGSSETENESPDLKNGCHDTKDKDEKLQETMSCNLEGSHANTMKLACIVQNKTEHLLPKDVPGNRSQEIKHFVNKETVVFMRSSATSLPDAEKATLVPRVSSEQSALQEPLPQGGGEKVHCSRISTRETVQESFLERSIDLGEEQALASLKIKELEKEISTLMESSHQTVSCLQDELKTKTLRWDQERKLLLLQIKEAQAQNSFQRPSSDCRHLPRSQDKTEPSVHPLADDESAQSTHAVKSDAGNLSEQPNQDFLVPKGSRDDPSENPKTEHVSLHSQDRDTQ